MTGCPCPVCGQPRLPAWPPWTAPDPHDAVWGLVYLAAGMWDRPHLGGLTPTRNRLLDAAVELWRAHGETVLGRALDLVARQPLPHGVDPAGKQACAALAARLGDRAAA